MAPVPRDQEVASWEAALSTATSGHHVGLFDLTELICHDAHYSPLPECSWLINGSPELPKARTGLAGRRAGAATGLCLTHGVELSVCPSFCPSILLFAGCGSFGCSPWCCPPGRGAAGPTCPLAPHRSDAQVGAFDAFAHRLMSWTSSLLLSYL